MRDYRGHLIAVLKLWLATINTTLAALGDFYQHRGLGAPTARSEDLRSGCATR